MGEIKRAIIIAKGDVQRVGYRDAVEKVARKLGIVGFVENLKPYDVKIVAEGEEELLKKFIELIKIKRPPINVERIEVKFVEPTKEFEYFEIKRGDWKEELGERMDVVVNVLLEMRDEHGSMLKQMLEKQDQTINIIKEGNKILAEKIDSGNKMLAEKIDSGNEKLSGKLDVVHNTIEEGNEKLSGKLDVIHTDLSINLKSFHQDTNQRFDMLEVKYGEISKNLVSAVEGIETMLEKSEKDRQDFRDSIEKLANAIITLKGK